MYKIGDELIIKDFEGDSSFITIGIDDNIHLLRKYLLDGYKPFKRDDYDALEWLQKEYTNSLPIDIQKRMVEPATLLYITQVFDADFCKKKYGNEFNEEFVQFDYFKTCKNRIANLCDDDEFSKWWWTKSKADNVHSALVLSNGNACSDLPEISSAFIRPYIILSAE